MIARVQRVLALLVIMAICFCWGVRTGQVPSYRPVDYTALDAAQLSTVAEGLQEKIAALEDELARVRRVQWEKLAGE